MGLMASMDKEAAQEGTTLTVEDVAIVVGYRVTDEDGEVTDTPIRYVSNNDRPYITAGLLDYAASYIRSKAQNR